MKPLRELFGSKKTNAKDLEDEGLALVHLSSRTSLGKDQDELVRMAQSLVAKGADLDVRDEYGHAALHWAADHHQDQLVGILLEGGADVGASVPETGLTPIELAISDREHWGHTFVTLLERGGLEAVSFSGNLAHVRAYVAAARHGYPELVKRYLEQGADPNQVEPTESGGFGGEDTVLMVAVKRRNVETVEALIDAGADASAPNRHGESPLSYAEKHSSLDSAIRDLLTQAGSSRAV